MVIDYLLLGVGLFGLIVGSITDIQKREVADWVNYFLIFSGIALRLIFSIYTGQWDFFGFGMLGLIIFTIIAYVMFLSGQWGGGDSKMLMAMGILFATYPESLYAYFDPVFLGFPFLLGFWLNLLIFGAIYGILWTIGSGVFHYKEMISSYKEWVKNKYIRKVRLISHSLALVLIVSGLFLGNYLFRVSAIVFGVIILGFFYLYIIIKSVENACMFRMVRADQLVEGDWPFDDIIVEGRKVFSKDKAIGLERKDIDRLMRLSEKKKIGKIKVKHGVPFVPSFLIALLFTLSYGNVLVFLI